MGSPLCWPALRAHHAQLRSRGKPAGGGTDANRRRQGSGECQRENSRALPTSAEIAVPQTEGCVAFKQSVQEERGLSVAYLLFGGKLLKTLVASPKLWPKGLSAVVE